MWRKPAALSALVSLRYQSRDLSESVCLSSHGGPQPTTWSQQQVVLWWVSIWDWGTHPQWDGRPQPNYDQRVFLREEGHWIILDSVSSEYNQQVFQEENIGEEDELLANYFSEEDHRDHQQDERQTGWKQAIRAIISNSDHWEAWWCQLGWQNHCGTLLCGPYGKAAGKTTALGWILHLLRWVGGYELISS